MIITCPECQIQYAVPENAIPMQGKKVKCSQCSHVWLQQPLAMLATSDDGVLLPESVDPIPDHSNLPVLAETPVKSASRWLKFATVIVLLLAGISHMVANHARYPALEGMLQMESTDGLVFEDFTVEKKEEDNKLTFNLSGNIVNKSNTILPLHVIRIRVLSEGGNEMGRLDFVPEVDSLMPKEIYHITPTVNNVSGNAEKLVLDMGNRWEMLVR